MRPQVFGFHETWWRGEALVKGEPILECIQIMGRYTSCFLSLIWWDQTFDLVGGLCSLTAPPVNVTEKEIKWTNMSSGSHFGIFTCKTWRDYEKEVEIFQEKVNNEDAILPKEKKLSLLWHTGLNVCQLYDFFFPQSWNSWKSCNWN